MQMKFALRLASDRGVAYLDRTMGMPPRAVSKHEGIAGDPCDACVLQKRRMDGIYFFIKWPRMSPYKENQENHVFVV